MRTCFQSLSVRLDVWKRFIPKKLRLRKCRRIGFYKKNGNMHNSNGWYETKSGTFTNSSMLLNVAWLILYINFVLGQLYKLEGLYNRAKSYKLDQFENIWFNISAHRGSLRAMMTLLPLLGLTWLLSLLVPFSVVFHYFFVIINTLQVLCCIISMNR